MLEKIVKQQFRFIDESVFFAMQQEQKKYGIFKKK